jgi:hypothetical protein
MRLVFSNADRIITQGSLVGHTPGHTIGGSECFSDGDAAGVLL